MNAETKNLSIRAATIAIDDAEDYVGVVWIVHVSYRRCNLITYVK